MQLLTEEFFKKILKHINSINLLTIKLLVKIIFYTIILTIIGYTIISATLGKYLPAVILLGALILGESAHYIRKTREKIMTSRATEENSITKKPKNKTLLNPPKPKNKTLLKPKTQKIKPKTISKKTTTQSNKPKIDKALLKPIKAKNKHLLKTSKPKNNNMLKSV